MPRKKTTPRADDLQPAAAPPTGPAAARSGASCVTEIFDLDVDVSDSEPSQQPSSAQPSTSSKSAAHDMVYFFDHAPHGTAQKSVCLACK